MWDIENGNFLRNPIHLFEWSDTLTQQTYRLTCPGVGSEFIAVTIIIYGELTCTLPTFPQNVHHDMFLEPFTYLVKTNGAM